MNGFYSQAARFGVGLGLLSVSRGYGPLPVSTTSTEEEIVHAKDGGRSARQIRVTTVSPKTIAIRKKTKG